MPGWNLSPRIVGFTQALRAHGLQIGSGETRDALAALACVQPGQASQFRLALRQTLAKSHEDQIVFDRVFGEYWQLDSGGPQVAAAAEPCAEDETTSDAALSDAAATQDLPAAGEIRAESREDRSSGASLQPRLMQRDFAQVSDAEMAELRELITLIGKRLANRAGRRWRRTRQGPADLRRSLRAALARGGEIWEIKRRRRRPQRLNLVVLADVSYSMDAYSRFFLLFIYAFQDLFRRMETFVFSTQLSRVSDALRRGRLQQALDALPDAVGDWAGGTRIAESLETFLHEHGDTLLGPRTVVIIVSDGWDTGGPEVLDETLRTLRLRCRQILWLDPLQGHPGYFASAAGAHSDSRWIDHCLPARDLRSLKALATVLQNARP